MFEYCLEHCNMARHNRINTWSLYFITGLLILLFVYAGMSKLLSYRIFANQLSRSPLVNNYAGLIAIALPVTELIIALLLSFKRTMMAGIYSFIGLMFIFTAYILGMLFSGVHLPCSCGGVIKYLGWKQHVAVNLFFIALAFIALWMVKRNKNIVVQRA